MKTTVKKTAWAVAATLTMALSLTACTKAAPVAPAPKTSLEQFRAEQAPLITYLQGAQGTLAAQGWNIDTDAGDASANTAYISACDTGAKEFKAGASLALSRSGTLNKNGIEALSQFLVNQAVADQLLQVPGPLDSASLKSTGVDLQYVFTKDSARYVYNLSNAATAPVLSIDASGACLPAPTTDNAAALRKGTPLFAG